MPSQILKPVGGLNIDTDAKYLTPIQYKFAKNHYYQINENSNEGTGADIAQGNNLAVVTPAPSNVLFTELLLPHGFNQSIGAFEFLELGEVYFFNWNSEGNNGIYRMNIELGTIDTIKVGSVFPFDIKHPISEHNVHLRLAYNNPIIGITSIWKWLIWTDGNGWQGFIDVETAIATGGYDSVLYPYFKAMQPHCDETEFYQLGVRPHIFCPSVSIVTDSPPQLSAVASQTNVTAPDASDGAASVVASGGTSPYTYLWSTGATTDSISGLIADTYTVTVTDADGTIIILTVVITSGIVTASTSSDVYMPLWSFSMENTSFVEGDSPIYFDIMSEPFFSHVASIRPYILAFPGTEPSHYIIYLLNDNVPDTPIGNGGFNCSLCLNTNTNCCLSYPTSFFPKFIQFASAQSAQVILLCNPQQFNAANYLSAMDFADAQCGLFGMLLAQEFNIKYKECSLCANGNNDAAGGANVAAACTTIMNGIHASYPSIKYTSDWNGINGNETVINGYGTPQLAIPNTTDIRIYASEKTFEPNSEWGNGRTADEYKASIDHAIDVQFPARVTELLTTGKKLAVTSWYSDNIHDFKGTFLQYYFLARYKVQEILIEATTSGTISYSLFRRLDAVNAKETNMNNQGNLLLMLKELFIEGNEIFTVSLPEGMFGVASVNTGTKHGTMMVINPTSGSLTSENVNIMGTDMPVTLINALTGTGLMTSCSYITPSNVPQFSIALLNF